MCAIANKKCYKVCWIKNKYIRNKAIVLRKRFVDFNLLNTFTFNDPWDICMSWFVHNECFLHNIANRFIRMYNAINIIFLRDFQFQKFFSEHTHSCIFSHFNLHRMHITCFLRKAHCANAPREQTKLIKVFLWLLHLLLLDGPLFFHLQFTHHPGDDLMSAKKYLRLICTNVKRNHKLRTARCLSCLRSRSFLRQRSICMLYISMRMCLRINNGHEIRYNASSQCI